MYLCHLGHPSNLQSISKDPLNIDVDTVSHTKHVWYSEHGTYYQFKFILERAMSATHVAVIPRMRTHSDKEEFEEMTILERVMTA